MYSFLRRLVGTESACSLYPEFLRRYTLNKFLGLRPQNLFNTEPSHVSLISGAYKEKERQTT